MTIDGRTKEWDDFFTEGTKDKNLLVPKWQQCLAFLAGEQYCFINKSSNMLENNKKVPSWRVQLVVNKTRPAVMRNVAKLSRNKAKMECYAGENGDITSARVGQQILDYILRNTKNSRKNLALYLWLTTCGKAFKKPFWNPDKGGYFAVEEELTEEQKERLGAAGADAKVVDQIGLGDIDSVVFGPFEFIAESGVEFLEDMGRFQHVKYMSIDSIQKKFKKTVKAEAVDDAKSQTIGGSLLKNIAPFLRRLGMRVGTGDKPGANVKESWELAGDKWRVLTYANGIVLHEAEYKDRLIVDYDYYRIPGLFWSQGLVEDLIPMQTEYNKSRSQIVENKNLMSRPKWFRFKKSGVSDDALTSQPAEVVDCKDPQSKPESWTPPPMPMYVLRHTDTLAQEINDVSSQHEVSRGMIPGSLRSGNAIAFLQEQDDTVLGPIVEEFELKEEEYCRLLLKIGQTKYKETRQIKIVGENRVLEVIEFDKSNLDGIDIYCKMGSSMPYSKAAKRQEIKDLYRDGAFGPPGSEQARGKLMSLLEMGNIEEIYDDIAVSRSLARMEIKQIIDGKYPMPQAYNNHQVHIEEADKFRNSPEYQKNSDKVKQALENYVKLHFILLAQASNIQLGDAGQPAT